jgi:hypothetical protein
MIPKSREVNPCILKFFHSKVDRNSYKFEVNKVESAYIKLMDYMFQNNFTSYDPYDGLNTPLDIIKINKFCRLGLVYLNKFSPVNLRKFFRVQKSKQLMALSTAANAMFTFNTLGNRESKFIYTFYVELKKKTLKTKYGYHCWDARHFPIQMQDNLIDINIPSIVGNEIFGTFLIHYYKATGNNEVLRYISDLADLFIDKFFCERDGFSFFKYRINDPDNKITLNASLKATSFLIKASEILDNDSFHDPVHKAIKTVVSLQKDDGRWNYTYFIDKQNEKKQVDFHQGFILDDILLFMNKYGHDTPYLNSYQKGIDFYYQKQFLPNGQSLYRYPKKWPVDIHSQSQGIITFTRAAKSGFGDHYFDFAGIIAEWTIKNMQDKDGHFYFLKYPWVTNKIPYIRWSDANMAYALSVFLSK